jgi:hypothetical protein
MAPTNQTQETKLMIKTTTAQRSALIAAMLAIPAVGFAGTGAPAKESKCVVEKVKESCISGDIGIDVYSQYVFHGLVLENQGAILQPYANFYFKVYEGDGFLNQVDVVLGIWNSFHSNHPSISTTRSWYEFDFLAGLNFNFGKNFSFAPTYVAYTSPGDYFNTAHVLQLRLAYDDTDLLGAFALHPYVMAEIELEGKAGNGPDEGEYYEIGIAPGTALGPVSVTFPIKAGFGANDYYTDDGYGFFSAGVALGYQLPMPECLGTWTASAGATFYHFGDPGDDATAIKNDEDHAWVFNGGLKVAF